MRIDQYPQTVIAPDGSWLVMETPSGTAKILPPDIQYYSPMSWYRKTNFYRGKILGEFSDEWKNKIKQGDFSDIFIGDRWLLPSSKTGLKRNLYAIVADFYYFVSPKTPHPSMAIYVNTMDTVPCRMVSEGRSDYKGGLAGAKEYNDKVTEFNSKAMDKIFGDVIIDILYMKVPNSISSVDEGCIVSTQNITVHQMLATPIQLLGFDFETKCNSYIPAYSGVETYQCHKDGQLAVFRYNPYTAFSSAYPTVMNKFYSDKYIYFINNIHFSFYLADPTNYCGLNLIYCIGKKNS